MPLEMAKHHKRLPASYIEKSCLKSDVPVSTIPGTRCMRTGCEIWPRFCGLAHLRPAWTGLNQDVIQPDAARTSVCTENRCRPNNTLSNIVVMPWERCG